MNVIQTDDVTVSSGRLRIHSQGPRNGGLVFGVHGLSANSRSFDAIASTLANAGKRVVTVDLRGRGFSEITASGTYGWDRHATDILEMATFLGHDTFDYVGHSMGAFVGLAATAKAPSRIRHLALIDAAGRPDAEALVPIVRGLERLGQTYPSADDYVRFVKGGGSIVPWSELWENHFRYDLVSVSGGVRALTDKQAIMEDLMYGASQDPKALWAQVKIPSLLVRASVPLGAGGHVLTKTDFETYLKTVPQSQSLEVDATHYTVVAHPRTLEALRRFLS